MMVALGKAIVAKSGGSLRLRAATSVEDAIDGAQFQATGGNFSHLASWTDADWQQARERGQRHARGERAVRSAPSEAAILLSIHQGLAGADSGVTAAEARWVVLRLAELLGWKSPELPASGD